MANPEHVAILEQGVDVWNKWREENPGVRPNLCGANLQAVDLHKANLSESELRFADFHEVFLFETNFTGANLTEAHFVDATFENVNLKSADLSGANLVGVDLTKTLIEDASFKWANLCNSKLNNRNLGKVTFRGADLTAAKMYCSDLSEANLMEANLTAANLNYSNLTGALLHQAVMVNTSLECAILDRCEVYGSSVWSIKGNPKSQKDIVITERIEPTVTVDNIKMAQFIHLLITNSEIRDVIDTITSKVVLILGRFTPERKEVLDAIREALRQRDKIPVMFDFSTPSNHDTIGAIKTLAGMSQFVIADLTDAKCITQELQAIVPDFTKLAVQPIIHVDDCEFGMFDHIRQYPWVMKPHQYECVDQLLAELDVKVVQPAEEKSVELRGKG